MTVCFICHENSSDYTTPCGHQYHLECFKKWFEKSKDCPYCRRAVQSLEKPKPLQKPCAVCKVGPSDFVTRCHHFLHRETCLGFNENLGKCPVCNIHITNSQNRELEISDIRWSDEELETLCPLSFKEIAVLACENEHFFGNVSLEFVVKKMKETETGFEIDNEISIRSSRNLSEIAFGRRNAEALKALIRLGSDKKYGFSYAIMSNNLDLLHCLIYHRTDVLELIKNEFSRIVYVLNYDEPPDVFERLIEIGFDPTTARCNYNQFSLLMSAVWNGCYDSVVKLVDHYGVDVNGENSHGHTALIISALNYSDEDPRVFDFLIERGADIHVKTHDGLNLFQYACSIRRLEVAKKFFELLKPDVNEYHADDGYTPLIHAIRNGDRKIIDFLLNNGADVNRPTMDGILPISFAVRYSPDELIQKFLDLGASLNTLPPGSTFLPIHVAAIMPLLGPSFHTHIEKLISLGANVNAVDANSNTILHLLQIDKYKKDLIEPMVKIYGADVNIKNNEGKRPIDLAMDQKDVEVLLELGSEPRAQNY